jgi:dienelactone hydrolase
MPYRLAATLGLCLLGVPVLADGPRDNRPGQVRPIPPPGIEVADADRQALERGLSALRKALDSLPDDPPAVEFRPDVEVFHKAVHDALTHREFFAPADIARAKALLAEGLSRAELLSLGQVPWTTQTGPVARGFVSRIDGSVQPFGVVVPPGYDPRGSTRYRLDLWFHGRGETLSEVNFLHDRRTNPGQFTPPDTIVLHPYGRYSNAFKFAGEVDVLEALEAVKRQYRVDENRIGVRGFSMGGAACWQFAVHYADRWYAAAPGAGFAETPRFLDVFQKEKLEPSWFERKLWRLYDCDLYAENLKNLPVVAYSGELDPQKQAADVMSEALAAQGIRLVHLIGPQTKHAYHPDTKREIDRRMDRLASTGRATEPSEVFLTTYTLKYSRMHWLAIDGLREHWEPATARARVVPKEVGPPEIVVETQNVTDLSFHFPPGTTLLGLSGPPTIRIDGQTLATPSRDSDRSWTVVLWKDADRWSSAPQPVQRSAGLRKRSNLQGPIDDAFMDAFVFVRPTGPGMHPRTAQWVDAELARALEHWRRQFRGQARVVDDSQLNEDQVATMNLVLWGDPRSNAVLKRIADRLPIHWGVDSIQVGDQTYDSQDHALVLIYPNPLNPSRYVVLNSGFTYRDYDYLNNARQVPKLPDWAVIDVGTPPDTRHPGRIVGADFLGERWELRPPRP